MNEKPNIGIRLASMFLDHFIMGLGLGIVCIILTIPLIMVNGGGNKIDTTWIIYGVTLAIVLLSLYFNKDIYRGQSFAKNILKLQVLKLNEEKIASPVQCVLRNLTIIIWPIEVIITLFSPTRRLGDFIAKTRIDYYKTNYETVTNKKEIMLALIIGILFTLILGGLEFILFENL